MMAAGFWIELPGPGWVWVVAFLAFLVGGSVAFVLDAVATIGDLRRQHRGGE